MRVVIEIETAQFDRKDQSPQAAAQRVKDILHRFTHGEAGVAPNSFLTRGVVGGDLVALHTSAGVHVGAYHTED